MPKKMKVLIVDDSPSVREILTEFLQEKYEVGTACDGKQALEQYRSFDPDIILLDMNMPQMGGLEVIESLREKEEDQNVYILVVTADTSFILKKEALTRGANDYLIKPYKPEELIARVGVAERQMRLSKQLRDAFASIDQEIAMLAEIQTRLLPKEQELLDGVSLQSMFMPSGRASGDFFDYFLVKEHVLRVAVADVSGHGARAAFLMGVVHTLLRTTESAYLDLGQAIQLMNRFLCSIIGDEPDYVSLMLADIDMQQRTMEYVNAGHCPALVKTQGTAIKELDQTTHVLGFFEIDPATRKLEIKEKTCLFFYTDGFYEWEIEPGEMLGLDRFVALVKDVLSRDSSCMEGLLEELVKITEKPHFRDDVTALLIDIA